MERTRSVRFGVLAEQGAMFWKRKTAARVWLERCRTSPAIRDAVLRAVEGSATSADDVTSHGPAALPPLFIAAAIAGVRPRAVAADEIARLGSPALERLRHLEMLARRGDGDLKASIRLAFQAETRRLGLPDSAAAARADQALCDLRVLALDTLKTLCQREP